MTAPNREADLGYIKRGVVALQLEVPAAVYDDFAPHLRTLIAEVERLREKIHDALFLCENSEHPYWCGIGTATCSCGADARNDLKRLIREALDGAL